MYLLGTEFPIAGHIHNYVYNNCCISKVIWTSRHLECLDYWGYIENTCFVIEFDIEQQN